jgi:hypothetical protein
VVWSWEGCVRAVEEALEERYPDFGLNQTSNQEINSCAVLCGPSNNTVLTGYADHGVSVRCIHSL